MYFDDDGCSVSNSEESLSDAVAKVSVIAIFYKLLTLFWFFNLITGDAPQRSRADKRWIGKERQLSDLYKYL